LPVSVAGATLLVAPTVLLEKRLKSTIFALQTLKKDGNLGASFPY
jgi:hypothetical protein